MKRAPACIRGGRRQNVLHRTNGLDCVCLLFGCSTQGHPPEIYGKYSHALIPANPELPYQPDCWRSSVVSAIVVRQEDGSCDSALSHWNVMTKKNAQLFVGGPLVIKRAFNSDISKEDLGITKSCRKNASSTMSRKRQDAFDQVKSF
jgi:hypothetical protein